MFLCCKGTDNDFFEQSSFIRKLNITTKKNKGVFYKLTYY